MPITLLSKSEFTTKNWSGGTTSELFIYPKTSNYKALNFDFRISTATVEIETSTFTKLPNVDRTLLVLDGEMELLFTEYPEKNRVLKPYDTACFSGGWNTVSKGKCVDFNLMTRKGVQGEVKGMKLLPLDTVKFKTTKEKNRLYRFVFFISGKGEILEAENNKQKLNSGDFIVIEDPANTPFSIIAKEESELAIVDIYKNN